MRGNHATNNAARDLRDHLGLRQPAPATAEAAAPVITVGLDCEWDTSEGMDADSTCADVVQLAYHPPTSGKTHVLVCQLDGSAIPEQLCMLLTDSRVLFVGRAISGDISRLVANMKDWESCTIQSTDVAGCAKKGDLSATQLSLSC